MAVSERAVQALRGQVEVLSLDVARLSQGLNGAQALLQGHSGGLEVYTIHASVVSFNTIHSIHSV
jgi:hypothetical protein